MENDTEVIRQQMAETRNALSEKVGAVEELVTSAVKETTQAVTKTVETVTNTVENTVNTVSDSVESVKEAVTDSVDTVKEALNVSACVEKYPWASMAGSVALGYALGSLLPSANGGRSSSGWAGTSHPAGTPAGYASPLASTGGTATSSSGSSDSDSSWSFLSNFMPVIDKLKGLAVGTAAGLVTEMLMDMVPKDLKPELSRMMDDATQALGGTVLRNNH